MTGFIPLKMLYQLLQGRGQNWSQKAFSKEERACLLPLHQCARFHIRNQDPVHPILLTHLWCASGRPVLSPKMWKLFRRTVSLGYPATTKPSGRAGSPPDIFGLQQEGKRHQCSSASGAAGNMGCQGASLTGTGRRGCLALETFCTHFWFLSFLAW